MRASRSQVVSVLILIRKGSIVEGEGGWGGGVDKGYKCLPLTLPAPPLLF